MNKELLNNPEVKEIALAFYHTKVNTSWEDFVKEQGIPDWQALVGVFEEKIPIDIIIGDLRSVKRLSDGEIFNVGDKTDKGIIDKIDIRHNNCYVTCVNTSGFIGTVHISELKKIKPLFKTTDGKDIYEGDEYWFVDKYYQSIHHTIFEGFEQKHKDYLSPIRAYFLTKEAAKEYILLNKPTLSINDVLSKITCHKHVGYPSIQVDELTELAKSKQDLI